VVDLGKNFRRGWKVYVKVAAVLILIILSAGERWVCIMCYVHTEEMLTTSGLQ